MADQRLERARHPQPTVPACVRIGHDFRYHADRGVFVCLRCQATRESWNVIEAEHH